MMNKHYKVHVPVDEITSIKGNNKKKKHDSKNVNFQHPAVPKKQRTDAWDQLVEDKFTEKKEAAPSSVPEKQEPGGQPNVTSPSLHEKEQIAEAREQVDVTSPSHHEKEQRAEERDQPAQDTPNRNETPFSHGS